MICPLRPDILLPKQNQVSSRKQVGESGCFGGQFLPHRGHDMSKVSVAETCNVYPRKWRADQCGQEGRRHLRSGSQSDCHGCSMMIKTGFFGQVSSRKAELHNIPPFVFLSLLQAFWEP